MAAHRFDLFSPPHSDSPMTQIFPRIYIFFDLDNFMICELLSCLVLPKSNRKRNAVTSDIPEVLCETNMSILAEIDGAHFNSLFP